MEQVYKDAGVDDFISLSNSEDAAKKGMIEY